MDVEVSSGDDAELGPKPNAPAKRKASADDDVGDEGASSADPHALNLISSSAPKQSDPSAIVQVPIAVPPTSGRRCKHPPPATRWNKTILQVD
jgi:hypothetical protein